MSRIPLFVFILLILRTRLYSLPKECFELLRDATAGKRLTSSELTAILQQVYTTEPDGTKTLLVTYRNRLSRIPIQETPQELISSNKAYFQQLKQRRSSALLDPSFIRALKALLFRIAIPSWRSKETLVILLHSFFLVARTVLSVVVARLDGRIVRDLVRADPKGFLRGLGWWFVLAVPSTYTNVMIKHLQSTLSLRFRTRLTRYIHDLYLSSYPDLRYYRLGLDAPTIEGVDQYITADVEAWAEGVSVLYGNLMKPTLDLLLFTSQLSRSLGVRGTLLLFGTYWGTVRILKAATPAFGRLAAVEAKLEGEYRAGMGRLGREGEEVAFYDGGKREKAILSRAYMNLIRHVNSVYKIRIAYEWTEDYVIKYLWSAAGYCLIAVPLLFTRSRRPSSSSHLKPNPSSAIASRTETYISNRRLLLSLADAGGRLMYAYKDILELAGVTERLYTLIAGLHATKPALADKAQAESGDVIAVEHVDVGVPTGTTTASSNEDRDPPLLVRDLTFSLRHGSGQHLMITGSNGVGKTAVARVLAGLWDPFEGVVSTITTKGEVEDDVDVDDGKLRIDIPGSENVRVKGIVTRPESLLVVPQRSYMPTGTLLDQVIYPDSYEDFLAKGWSIEHEGEGKGGGEGKGRTIRDILESVFLGYLPEREGGWSTRKEWRDVLSGGEKQRMGMARVFYRLPKFAILDECTSAVSSDVEGRMYEHAKALGITLVTISLRPSLMKYHTQLLTLHGTDSSSGSSGRWTLSRISEAGTPLVEIGEEQRELMAGLEKEMKSIEEKLGQVDVWKERIRELDEELRVQEV